MKWFLPISLLIRFELVADIFAKEWQLKSGAWRAACALGAYVVANSFWLFALRSGAGLARGGLIFAVSCAVMAVVVGVWMYKEPVSNLQMLGIVLGIFSLGLICWEEQA
jgi:multidrug transporter EmrE-like cation transporter